MPTFLRTSAMPVGADELFAWHARPGAFERLRPPWQDIRILERTGDVATEGSRVSVSVPVGPLRLRWVAEHYGAVVGREFRDRQVEGPFAAWDHHHRFVPDGPSASVLEDEIHYELPLGGWIGENYVRLDLERLFTYRHETTLRDLSSHEEFSGRGLMKILVTGSSGLVGSALVPFLTTGHTTVSEAS